MPKKWTNKDILDLVDKSFNGRKLLKYIGEKKNGKNGYKYFYLIECIECGRSKILDLYTIKNHKCISCYNPGIIKAKNRNGGLNRVYLNYRKAAEKRNLEFKLTKEELKNIVVQNCYYCGIEPFMTIKNVYNTIIYNGIDRLDNSQGYVIVNCVACCTRCNKAKHIMNKNEFIDWIKKVYNNLSTKEI